MAKKEKVGTKDWIIKKAIDAGIYSLISQPGMREEYAIPLKRNLNKELIYSVADKIEEEIVNRKIKTEEQAEFLYKNLASFIASGSALKDEWKKRIMEKTHDGKVDQNMLEKIVGFLKPNKFKGEEYLKKAENAYGTMYDLLANNEIAQQKIPGLVKSAEALKMYGFLDVALDTFRTSGMMDNKTYNKLSKELYKETLLESQEGMKGIEKYILSKKNERQGNIEGRERYTFPNAEKIAASILGITGAAIVLLSSGITGAVIGSSKITWNISGVLLMAISVFMFLTSSKRKSRICKPIFKNT